MSASLSGTLNGMDVLSQIIAAQQEEQARLAQQTQQASQQAGAAQQQYEQAAAAPPPDVGGLQAFLPTLLGNIASVMGKNPGYAENAHQRLKEQRSELLAARADNLSQLRNVWNQKAEAAQKAGDLETTLTARQKSEQLSKVYGDLLQQQHMDAATKLQDQKDQAARDLQAQKDAAALARQEAKDKNAQSQGNVDFLGNEIKSSPSQQKYLPLTNVSAKMMPAALAYAKEHGIPAVNKNDAARLDKLDTAQQNLNDMANSMRTFLPKDWKDARTMAANKLSEATRSGNPEILTWKNYYDALIGQLVALAGGQGSGVRINQAEIDRQIKIAPGITTPLPMAEQWIKRTQKMIDNAQRPVLGRTNLSANATSPGGAVPATHRFNPATGRAERVR